MAGEAGRGGARHGMAGKAGRGGAGRGWESQAQAKLENKMSTKPILYVNAKGYNVTRHSYSGSETFSDCARKYYLQRVQGWVSREDRAARHFGIALEHGVTFWHQRGQNISTALAEFNRMWDEHAGKEYIYSKIEGDWARLRLTGQELLRLYAVRYPGMPYRVENPTQSFQVNVTFEVFPGTALAGLEFTGYIDLVAARKADGSPIIVDMKTSGKDVPELTVLDPQLRSYAWAKEWTWVAFLWFRKMGREISKGDRATMLEPYAGLEPGTAVTILGTDDFGVWVTTDSQVEEKMKELFVGKSKAVEAARLAYLEANGKHVQESALTKQRLQFREAYITPESAQDIGKSIKRDLISIETANRTDSWPMNSGVRFPHEKCPMCEMRGICSGNSELRDQLVTRKETDDLDFSLDSE
jgi:hypothetical protein